MGFPRQEHGSGLPFPPPGDLTGPGIGLRSLASAASGVAALALSHSPPLGYNDTFIRDTGRHPGCELRTLNLT